MTAGLSRELIALRVARELREGMVVNLGIGLPTLVSNFLPPDQQILFQSENGILGYGRISEEEFDPDLINAGGQPVTLAPGASFFDSATSFAMIRGGHIDVAVLGGLEVSEKGDLANWYLPERGGGSIGGAMDLAFGARRVIVAMTHTTADGRPRVRTRCEYPLTAPGVVDLIVTDLAVIKVEPGGLLLTEVAPGVDPDFVQSRTEARLRPSPDLREMEL
ncbi:MAG: succinyl-CoA--3-ketoacid-CoA transferase [Chloroflexi bacterium RBG_16_68_14]|nr:MAG: succinyl-CoA--3-ketoacid-CoA transferase [Chloroflexi bacterium RBG_16_68_14]